MEKIHFSMKSYSLFIYLFALLLLSIDQYPKEVSLFDGFTFNGWEGDTLKTWRIEDKMIIGIKDTVNKTIARANPSAFNAKDTLGCNIQGLLRLMFTPPRK
jgi:hypothetical protein